MIPAPAENPYRVLDEARVAEALAHYSWPDRIRSGGEAARETIQEAERAIERWTAQRLPCRREGAGRWFDFYEVVDFMRWAARVKGDPVYMTGPGRTFRDAVEELQGHGEGIRVHLRRTFRLPGRANTGQVRLRVPLPIDDPGLPPATVEVLEPDSTAVETVRSEGRLEIRVPAPADDTEVAVEVCITQPAVDVAVRVDPSRLLPYDTSDPDYALYTRPWEGLIRVSSSITRLAESLCAEAADAWAAVTAFWWYFFEHMWAGPIHHDGLHAVDPLGSLVERGWFDCYTGSSLLVALCRARGIPARVVNGFTLYRAIPCPHYWAEVFLPPYGWVPFDLASWDLALGDRLAVPWSERYLARLDPRITMQRFPRQITGPTGIRLPPAWYALPRVRGDGLETTYYALETGVLLYSDWLRVYPAPQATPRGGAHVCRG